MFENVCKAIREAATASPIDKIEEITGYSKDRIETAFDCTILYGPVSHRKDGYWLFINDHDDGASYLTKSDIDSMMKHNNRKNVVVVKYELYETENLVNANKLDFVWTDVASVGYSHQVGHPVYVYGFSEESLVNKAPTCINYDVFTNVDKHDIAQIKRDIEEANKIAGHELFTMVESNQLDESNETGELTETDIGSFEDEYNTHYMGGDY